MVHYLRNVVLEVLIVSLYHAPIETFIGPTKIILIVEHII
jgi:hypothetical protein